MDRVDGFLIEGKQITAWVYSYTSVRIETLRKEEVDLGGKQIVKIDNVLKEAIVKILENFSENYFTITEDKKPEFDKKNVHLANMILSRFSKRLSVWGLMHFLDLLGMQVHPCDEKLFGYDAMAILKSLNIYLNHCRKEHFEFMDKVYQDSSRHMGAAERQFWLAKCIGNNPDHKAIFDKTMDKIQERVDREIYEEERGNKYLEDAKANFEKNIAEIFPNKYREFIKQYDAREAV